MKLIIQLKTGTSPLLITLALLCFGLLPRAHAVSPAPDGGYPGGNTAEGQNALLSRTTGGFNTAVGWFSLESLTTGSFNTGVGAGTLVLNSGDENTATGVGALLLNTTGGNNTATGFEALFSNINGAGNTANGYQALSNNTTGSGNIALGINAGSELTTGSGNIDIGNNGMAGEGNTIRIGNGNFNQSATFIAGIYGATASGGAAVYINSDGHLGTAPSSARFKQDIHTMDKVSETVLALRPVTFRYKPELDPKGIPQFGLVAEEVEKVNPDLVVRDKEGKPYSVRCEQVNAMLLNEFLKEYRRVEEQDRKLKEQKAVISHLNSTVEKQGAAAAQQQKEIQALTASLKEQAAQIQRVSAQVEMGNPSAHMVLNNQ
jgi:uncharacterized coiled-coil protein SlyX